MIFSSDIFKPTYRASPRQPKVPPPLILKERITSEQTERATILRNRQLARFESSYSLPFRTTQGSLYLMDRRGMRNRRTLIESQQIS